MLKRNGKNISIFYKLCFQLYGVRNFFFFFKEKQTSPFDFLQIQTKQKKKSLSHGVRGKFLKVKSKPSAKKKRSSAFSLARGVHAMATMVNIFSCNGRKQKYSKHHTPVSFGPSLSLFNQPISHHIISCIKTNYT